MGQRADADKVDSAGGDLGKVAVAHIARSLDDRASGDYLDRLFHISRAHIVEHNYVRSGAERLVELLEGLDLDLDLECAERLPART